MKKNPFVFGVRHFSPAGAWQLRKTLDERKPQLVLIEGPSDLSDLMEDIAKMDSVPPIAAMAYTKEAPIRSILYPFAEYSPEYQAILWAKENQAACRFIDLPAEVMLALPERSNSKEADTAAKSDQDAWDGDSYYGEDQESFWERYVEHNQELGTYQECAAVYGRELRGMTLRKNAESAYDLVRESFMRRQMEEAIHQGVEPDEMIVITGAYHIEGLHASETAMTDEEWKSLPRVEVLKTLMPYSYYRLSSLSGYGAGNQAPAYFEMLYEDWKTGHKGESVYRYLSGIAGYQRTHGNPVSSAEVIEAVRLANSLANLYGTDVITRRDLRDAAITCMGHGHFSEIATATAEIEVGRKIGSLPAGISRTSIQEDFYRRIDECKLEKYKSATAEELKLDLREKLTVKSSKSAFLDRNRSFFLHQLRVLGIDFAKSQGNRQEKATWAEYWVLQWTPEAEIQIVEAALKGDTVEYAVSHVLKETAEKEQNIDGIAKVIEEACLCGMEASFYYAVRALQRLSTDTVSVTQIAKALLHLSAVMTYGDIRKLDYSQLKPVMEQLFLRGCLLFPGACICDNTASLALIDAASAMNQVALGHDFLDAEQWERLLAELSARDDINTRISGFCMALLAERGKADAGKLGIEMEKRLSKGVPADLGAGWFEGLSMRNHYALIARVSIWEKLSDYVYGLDEDEFKRALLFLRRAFADYSAGEKSDIAENLGEIWHLNPFEVSSELRVELSAVEQDALDSLDEFDFEDI